MRDQHSPRHIQLVVVVHTLSVLQCIMIYILSFHKRHGIRTRTDRYTLTTMLVAYLALHTRVDNAIHAAPLDMEPFARFGLGNS